MLFFSAPTFDRRAVTLGEAVTRAGYDRQPELGNVRYLLPSAMKRLGCTTGEAEVAADCFERVPGEIGTRATAAEAVHVTGIQIS